MKRYLLNSEFFGGLIYDKISKSNFSIDKTTYGILKLFEQNKDFNFIKYAGSEIEEITIEDFVDIINDLSDIGLIESNIEFRENKGKYYNFLSAPLRIFYDITYSCNFNCKHCFSNSGKSHPGELELKEKIKLIKEIKSLGVTRISIAGGEPFSCTDLFPFLNVCNDLNIDVSITTNGSYLTKSVIEKLNEINLKNLTVSFDGGNQKSIEMVRGKGSYEKIIRGLENLKKYYKYKYSMKTTMMKNNVLEIDEIVEKAIFYGCNTIKFNCVREDGRAVSNKTFLGLDQTTYINVVKRIEEAKNKYADKINIKAPLNVYCDEEYNYIEELGFGCFAGKESICIDPLGNVKPCSHFPSEFICGNIKDTTLEDIWFNSDILKSFRELEGNGICRDCKGYSKCRAGCRYRAFLDGNINGIDPYCYLMKNTGTENR